MSKVQVLGALLDTRPPLFFSPSFTMQEAIIDGYPLWYSALFLLEFALLCDLVLLAVINVSFFQFHGRLQK
jgi:hypothetical protein